MWHKNCHWIAICTCLASQTHFSFCVGGGKKPSSSHKGKNESCGQWEKTTNLTKRKMSLALETTYLRIYVIYTVMGYYITNVHAYYHIA